MLRKFVRERGKSVAVIAILLYGVYKLTLADLDSLPPGLLDKHLDCINRYLIGQTVLCADPKPPSQVVVDTVSED